MSEKISTIGDWPKRSRRKPPVSESAVEHERGGMYLPPIAKEQHGERAAEEAGAETEGRHD